MPADPFNRLVEKIRPRLARLYSDQVDEACDKLTEVARRYTDVASGLAPGNWDQRDVVLITYADQIHQRGRTPLAALRGFLRDHGLDGCLNTVHLLPFFPYTSDDGFSVADYRQVDPAAGTWSDVGELGEEFRLMFDLVLNHCSQQHEWFGAYLAGRQPQIDYFIEADPGSDLASVTRPRSLPLLTRFETNRGQRHVWTTFSADQVDLNFATPGVLAEMVDVLLFYVASGARIVRLDAIAYLWKRVGTSCIHLPETHEVVKLLRDVLDELAGGGVWLLTETNVPHRENFSYFGEGDEAHIVYQFSLAPLVLDALLRGDARPLVRWLEGLEPTPPGTTFLNFTASHDGIGVRPLEGLVDDDRFARLVEDVRLRGGHVSTKRNADGSESPYELNITYFDALSDPGDPDPERHARRFLASQALMLAQRGIPAVYFHSLFGTPNHHAGVAATGRTRSINRRKFDREELEAMLADPTAAQGKVYREFRRMLSVRAAQAAFHPDAAQEVWPLESSAVVGLLRTSLDGRQRILALVNVSAREQRVDLTSVGNTTFARDLLSKSSGPPPASPFPLAAYQVAWLESHD